MRSAIGKHSTHVVLAPQVAPLALPSSSPESLSSPMSYFPSVLSGPLPAAASADAAIGSSPSANQPGVYLQTAVPALPEHRVFEGMIQNAVRVAVREEAAAAFAAAASTLTRDFQSSIKTAVREAIREELEPILASAAASSAAATALAGQQLGDRVAAAVEAAAERLHESMGVLAMGLRSDH
jgi:hypothetical protein